MRNSDPRGHQIAVLGGLLLYGVWMLDFGVSGARITLVLTTCLAAQYICTRLWTLPRYDPKSALISGLSLCLLLRTGDPVLAVVAAVITIASKFLIRVDHRHLFNPTNFGIVVSCSSRTTSGSRRDSGATSRSSDSCWRVLGLSWSTVRREATLPMRFLRASSGSWLVGRSGSAIPSPSRCTCCKAEDSCCSRSS